MSALAPSLQAYFTDRLMAQRAASLNTIAAYKLTFRLLLSFASRETGRAPSFLDIADLDAPLVARFLDHLEHERGNSVRSRNSRLAAVHSLFAYLALRHPDPAASIQRVLAIPPKRTEHNLVTYLTDSEAEALFLACDQASWTGRRDHAMFVLAIQAGLRISELAGLTRSDVVLGTGANVHVLGKGRKERRTPLVAVTREVLRRWLDECPGTDDAPLFPTVTGQRLSRDGIEHRLSLHLNRAQTTCPSLGAKHVTMHTLRHTAAMRLLLAGNDITVIALWLGHEQVTTTNILLMSWKNLLLTGQPVCGRRRSHSLVRRAR
jgi:integrase/recombinase XerD